jgi:hypothetical protein
MASTTSRELLSQLTDLQTLPGHKVNQNIVNYAHYASMQHKHCICSL